MNTCPLNSNARIPINCYVSTRITYFKGIVPRYKGCLPTNEPACAHTVNENWGGGRLISSRLIFKAAWWGSLQRVWCFKHCMCSTALTYQYSYPLATHSWRLWASRLDHQQNLCPACIRPPHTPVHYTAILGVPILPVPTLIEFLN